MSSRQKNRAISVFDSASVLSQSSLRSQFFYPSNLKNKKFYNGSGSQGMFDTHSESLKSTLLSPQNSQDKPKSRRFHISAVSLQGTLDHNSEMICEASLNQTKKSKEPQSKLKSLLEVSSYNKLDLEESLRKNKNNYKPPNISSYLSFLHVTNNDSTNDFSAKLYEKYKKEKETHAAEPKTPAQWNDKQWIEQILERRSSDTGRKSKSHGRISIGNFRRESNKLSTQLNMPSLTRKSSLVVPLENIGSQTFSRTSIMEEASPSMHKRSLLVAESKKDEQRAKELSQEVAINYKNYLINAAKSKELKVKMNTFLRLEGVLHVFTGRMSKNSTLQSRVYDVYDDMIEKNEEITLVGKSVINFSPSQRSLKVRRNLPKLIPVKYRVYKNVNNELLNINTQFKIQELQSLEGKLVQAKYDLDHKRDEVLMTMKKVNLKKYSDLKKQCEKTETMLSLYDEYDLVDFSASIKKQKKEVAIIHKNIDEVMKNWRGFLNS